MLLERRKRQESSAIAKGCKFSLEGGPEAVRDVLAAPRKFPPGLADVSSERLQVPLIS